MKSSCSASGELRADGKPSSGATLPTVGMQDYEVLTRESGQCRVNFHFILNQIFHSIMAVVELLFVLI